MAKEFTEILSSMLAEIDNSVDKREGSLIWSALAPTAARLAEAYAYFDSYVDLTLPDTACGSYLDRLCGIVGITRKEATAAVIKGEFRNSGSSLLDVEEGTEFACGNVIYKVGEKISSGVFLLECETAGSIGNLATGSLLPVSYVSNLFTAEIKGIYAYGEDTEDDAALRKRYIENLTAPAFGGNVADYESKVLTFDGVGAAKIFPVCSGAGTVGIVLGSDSKRAVDSALVMEVSNAFNAKDSDNLTCGLAPIGHDVKVKSASDTAVNVYAKITLESGASLTDVRSAVTAAVADYINGIDFEQSLVYKAPVEMAILSVSGVADIKSLKLNGVDASYALNKTYAAYGVPVFGTLTLEV